MDELEKLGFTKEKDIMDNYIYSIENWFNIMIDTKYLQVSSNQPLNLQELHACISILEELKDKDKDLCSICGKQYLGYGNNAWPINEGKCCDECNNKIVLTARLQALARGAKEND